MVRYILSLPRINKQLIMVLADSILLILMVFISISLRLGEIHIYSLTEQGVFKINWQFFITPIIAVPIFYRFGIYRETIRFIGFDTLWSIMQAVSLYSLICGIALYLFPIYSMPRSVILINWIFLLLSIGCIRMGARWLFTKRTGLKNSLHVGTDTKRVLVYGAGDTRV